MFHPERRNGVEMVGMVKRTHLPSLMTQALAIETNSIGTPKGTLKLRTQVPSPARVAVTCTLTAESVLIAVLES